MRAGEPTPRTRLRTDPSPAFHFRIEIDGLTRAAFRECHGLISETEVFEIAEGGLNHVTHRLPGRSTYSPITLARGWTLDLDLWRWRRQVIEGSPDAARGGDVVIVDSTGEETARWTFVRGWPSRWEGPVLVAGISAVAVEVIEIVHEGLFLVDEDIPGHRGEAAP